MILLKDMALVSNPKEWAAKVEGKQSDEVKAWLCKPKDDAKLLAALVHELLGQSGKKRASSWKEAEGIKHFLHGERQFKGCRHRLRDGGWK